jgi:hypothetical protein
MTPGDSLSQNLQKDKEKQPVFVKFYPSTEFLIRDGNL